MLVPLTLLAAACGSGAPPPDEPPASGEPDVGRRPDAAARLDGAPPAPAPGGPAPTHAAPVVISEIMYHAVLDDGADGEEHEWLEIANRSAGPVDLAEWRLAGTVQFTFPKVTLARGQHLVIARNPQKVAALWKLAAGTVIGPYAGTLDNGGGRIVLTDGAGTTVESLAYDDKAPWPMGADAFGVGEAWLPQAMRPLAAHRNKGYSLERISYDVPPADPVNWTTSKLDGSTPGAASGQPGAPEAIVKDVRHLPGGDAGRLQARPMEKVLVRVTFSAQGTVKTPEVEYHVDLVETKGALASVPLRPVGDVWEAELPGHAADTIVRYRIRADRGGGEPAVIGPRATDPMTHHSYFVGPELPGKAPAYQLFISRANWGQLYKYAAGGRATGCTPNANWNARVPAVLIHDGQVRDIQARIQGSPYNRQNGPAVMGFPADKLPVGQSSLSALGWRLYLPRYAPIDGSNAVILNKRAHECNFVRAHVGGRLFESVGIPSSNVSGARVYVNGHYTHFYSKFERPDEDMLARFFPKGTPLGDLFKVVGWDGQQGPYTWADGRELTSTTCRQFTEEQLYTYNYDRKTPEYKATSSEVLKLIKDFHAARTAGPAALKAHFMETWDHGLVLNYIAVINWLIPWDDFFQNHYLYRKADGKWMFMPWDFDLMMGGFTSDQDRAAGLTSPQSSFYIGELDNRSNRVVGVKWNNYIKDAFIKTFRSELQDKLRQLAAKELQPAVIDKLVTESLANYDRAEAAASMTRAACAATSVAGYKSFATARNGRIAAGEFQ